ncbi:MAG TPA: holo-ACP synthase [Thermotogota bacterium]|nr:holo-ACP synthase [Thermotogota bacterium]HRW34663.1 holo-ACP synthase [Thermotogota bacterium]
MILGFGIDLMDLRRLDEKKIERLQAKVLTGKEREQLLHISTLKRKKEFFSGRFCAREAFYKATGRGVRDFELNTIAVSTDENGKPYLEVPKEQLDFFFSVNCRVFLTITHDGEYTVAGVIVEGIE